jgi:transposase
VKIDYDSCTREELIEAHKEQVRRYEQLAHELDQIKRMLYGAKSERFVSTQIPDQLNMFAPDATEAQPSSEDTHQVRAHERKEKIKRIPVRKDFPDHLPRRVVTIKPEEDTDELELIGKEQTKVLNYVPPQIEVIVFEREKYKRTNADGSIEILIGDLPDRGIDKGNTTPAFQSHVISDKYLDHLPLYRQHKRLKRLGIDMPQSTLNDIVRRIALLLTPLYELIVEKTLQSQYLQADESSIRVLNKDDENGSMKGCMQVVHAVCEKLAYFRYTPTKEKHHLLELLEGFSGYLQTDGNASYKSKDAEQNVTLLHCWAHARRKFEQSLENDEQRASHMLTEIQLLYAIERRARDALLSNTELLALRQQETIPVLHQIKAWLDQESIVVLPSSAIGKAIAYTLNHWQGLTRYTVHGYLQIDNNPVENLIRPLALGRKNFMFAGSNNGAKRAAIMYTLFAMATLNGIDPPSWLTNVIYRIQSHPVNRLHELLPLKGYQFVDIPY